MVNEHEVSTAALAYLGDSVIELCVREYLVELGITDSKRLNETARNYVRADAQAEAVKNILPMLDETESAFFSSGKKHRTYQYSQECNSIAVPCRNGNGDAFRISSHNGTQGAYMRTFFGGL